MAKFTLTLLLYASFLLAFASSSNADVSVHHRRDHSDLGRLIKKRASPNNILGNLQPSQAGEASLISSPLQPTPATSAAAQTTPANSVSVQTSPAAASSSASPSSSGGNLLSSVLGGGLLPTQSSSASSTVSTATSSASISSSSTPAQAQASKTSAETPTQSVLYLTTNGAPTSTQTSSTSSSSGMSHAAVTVLIIIAASVGAAGIAWTIIRKWKFRPSSDFDSRMQPIDWHPGANDDSGLPGRRRPVSQASSFHSGSVHGQIDGGYGATTLNPIPDHDFTAGPAHLAPVGGYADLARGPSTQPMVQEPLGRSPSIKMPVQHDQYGVPLHHGY
ncbi:hypothetical protein JVU11DRAFT_5013 [Chiua virens]|nr:hypothetical protein JVU11DRAFT_5013 [Chiua virens]